MESKPPAPRPFFQDLLQLDSAVGFRTPATPSGPSCGAAQKGCTLLDPGFEDASL